MESSFSRLVLLSAICWLLFSSDIPQTTNSNVLYDESFRPQYHFTPAKNWMNDPNGPVYYKGEYHLFYQYNPFGDVWGHMSWGHAVSRDLVHWQNLPVALPEENGVMIFSGSVVVDWHNSSGFCRAANAREASCLVAIYTGYDGKLQFQNLAYSNDQGRTWTKYSGNPVIDLQMENFRDPKVFWHDESHKWVMATALSAQHKIRFFGSADLKHWTAMSDFGPAGGTGGVWECPDLFRLPIEGEAGQTRWVLSVNLNPGGPAGGSGDQYFVGAFDGSTFIEEKPGNEILWADYGKDFYASTSFADIPASDGRRIWMGWLVNWDYAAKVPTHPWRGVQSIPRTLGLRRFPDGIRVVQSPVKELEALRENHTSLESQSIAAANRILNSKKVRGDTLEVLVEMERGTAEESGLRVRKGANEETTIGVDWGLQQVFVDRTRSGNTAFDESFAGRHAGPLRGENRKQVTLRILVDRSSVEVFANVGSTVISDAIFPSRDSKELEAYSKNGEARIVKLDVWSLKSSWQ